jgi:hypothetical protein
MPFRPCEQIERHIHTLAIGKILHNMLLMCHIIRLEKGHTHSLHPRSADGPSSHMCSRSADADGHLRARTIIIV